MKLKPSVPGKLLAVLLAVVAAPASAAGETVTACFDEEDRSGYAYPDADGTWRGAAVDLVREIARQAGVQLVLQPLPWARCLRLAKAEAGDAVDFAFYASTNPQRLADYAFLGPIHHVTGGAWLLAARADLPHELDAFETLGRYRLCGLAGSNYAWLKEVGVDRHVDAGAHNMKAAVTKLTLGRCDYLLGSVELRASAQRHGIGRATMDKLAFAAYPRASQVGQYLLFNRQRPGQRQMFDAFAAAHDQLSRAGTVKRIYGEYGLAP